MFGSLNLGVQKKNFFSEAVCLSIQYCHSIQYPSEKITYFWILNINFRTSEQSSSKRPTALVPRGFAAVPKPVLKHKNDPILFRNFRTKMTISTDAHCKKEINTHRRPSGLRNRLRKFSECASPKNTGFVPKFPNKTASKSNFGTNFGTDFLIKH